MKQIESSNKIISFPGNFNQSKNKKEQPNTANPRSKTNVFAITSGKGGVGKTNIVANLGFMLTQLGKKVLIVDADLGLANIDILLGLAPKYNLSHVILGDKTISEIIIDR